ncbi:MAG TPA: serine hydrolase domain-containing protein, partial [Gemmatimonadaceae bacterium]|nr:serine hydrolase domain-containing protein [Gemmatimonadaceae bacterium]
MMPITFASTLLLSTQLAQTPAVTIAAWREDLGGPHVVSSARLRFDVIDSLMSTFANRAKVPGIAYGIVIDGKVVHIGVAGVRNVETGAKVDTNSVFRIASMTKSFTALSVLKLRDDGKLSLDDPAERYVPELK